MREINNADNRPGFVLRNVPGFSTQRRVLNQNSPIPSPTIFVERHGSSIQYPAGRWMVDPADLGTVVTATWQLIDTAVLQMNSQNAQGLREFWFGDGCDHQRVLTELQQLQTCKNAVTALLFACCAGPDYTHSIMAAPRGGTSNSLPCTTPKLLLGALSRRGATVGAGAVTIGMCIATLLHEFTHIYLNTDDVDYNGATGPGAPKVYGALNARALAEAGQNAAAFQNNALNRTQNRAGNQASAIDNAENWCFYLTERLHRAGVAAANTIDWTGASRVAPAVPTTPHGPRPRIRPPRPTTPHGPRPNI